MKKISLFAVLLLLVFSTATVVAGGKSAPAKPMAQTTIKIKPTPSHYFMTIGEFKAGSPLWEVYETKKGYTVFPTTWVGEKWIVSGKTGGQIILNPKGELIWQPHKGKEEVLKPFQSKNGQAWGF